ncbi:hypothetical protein GCM10009087_24160 [Sphingomonas oligophenolica]|uniref:GreA/GreB family elongation factor n=1 Tax=Sphingomonas oligophenolica TaxID=301154 RepID=A0ABU9Y1A4_9SPHN
MGTKIDTLETAIAAEADEVAREVLKRELRYWNTRQTTAIVGPVPEGEEVAFGARVTFRLNGVQRTIDLVGSDEADPAVNRIAFTAPLAAAMIGAGPGDRLDFNGTPDAIEIVAVGRPDVEPDGESRS